MRGKQGANNAEPAYSSSESDELETSQDTIRGNKELRGRASVNVLTISRPDKRSKVETEAKKTERLQEEERLLQRMFHEKQRLLREQREMRLRTQQLLEELSEEEQGR
eukprot:758995-Hanusia_phi.AAC.3